MAHGRAGKRLGMLLVVAAVSGCASGGGGMAAAPAPAADPMPAPTPELIAQGEQVFGGAGGCTVCHGDGGMGGSFGPDLSDDDWAWIDPASATALSDLADLIRTGITEPRVSDTGMPPMGGRNLSDEQLSALAAYILSL